MPTLNDFVDVILRFDGEPQKVKCKKYFKITIAVSQLPNGIKHLQLLRRKQELERFLITGNVKKLNCEFLSREGKATIRFNTPNLNCFLKVSEPTSSNNFKFAKFISMCLKCEVNNLPNFNMTNKPECKQLSTAVTRQLNAFYRGPAPNEYWNNITKLDLTNRNLSELPAALGHVKLLHLILDGNELSCISRDWKWIHGPITQSLKHLSLKQNKLTSLPCKVQRFFNLRSLDLSDNLLKQLPHALFDPAKNLKELNLSGNKLMRCLPIFTKPLATLHLPGGAPLTADDYPINQNQVMKIPERLVDKAGCVLLRNIINYEKYFNWLFSSPGLLPEEVRERLDNYTICSSCLKRMMDVPSNYVETYSVHSSSLATVCILENPNPHRPLVRMEAGKCARCISYTKVLRKFVLHRRELI